MRLNAIYFRIILVALCISLSPVAKAGLYQLHAELTEAILKKINNKYPLPEKILWSNLNFETKSYEQEKQKLKNVLHRIRTNTSKEAISCQLLLLHVNLLDYRNFATGSSDLSKIPPGWYTKANQLTDMGVKIIYSGAPEAISFYYFGSLGNEIVKFTGTYCSQIYKLFSIQNEQWHYRSNMSDYEWINLKSKKLHNLLKNRSWEKEEKALFRFYELTLLLDQWTNCGLFDPTPEEINQFWEMRYKNETKIKQVVSKINQLKNLVKSANQNDEILYYIEKKLPVEDNWPNSCAPKDV
ncbi:MAG: hypothetical protein OEY52_10965 [Gammaproteobacteria bacterium]|nr:hypothetical protein [Gammaproteobacteria bacterium]